MHCISRLVEIALGAKMHYSPLHSGSYSNGDGSESAVLPPPSICWRVGPFELGEQLSAHDSRAEFDARHRFLDTQLTLRLHTAKSALEVERFWREVSIRMHVGDHPNLVSARLAGEDLLEPGGARVLWMATTPTGGHDLDEIVATTGGTMLPGLAVPLAIQMLAAVRHLHARGVLHSALEPGAWRIWSDHSLRLAEFSSAVVRPGGVLPPVWPRADSQRPPFRAPEQWAGSIEERTDIHAVGATLFTLIAGHPPFGDDESGAIRARATLGLPPPLANVDRHLATIVATMLARDPQDRYRTAAEAQAALERWMARVDRMHLVD